MKISTDKAILLVEDNPDDIELTKRAFIKNNLLNPIVVAEDGAAALDYLFARGSWNARDVTDRPALVLLDLKLPKIEGVEVLRQIREDDRSRTIPVVILTVFHILLPEAKSEEVHDQSPALGKRDMQAARILLVEDDAAVASGLATLLELDGFAMRVVATGGESFAAITDFEPDALVLDVGLPDIDGIELYQEIHRRWPRLPVIFSTGHGDRGRIESQLAGNDVRLILKPYDSADLIDLLQTILPPLLH